MKKILTPIILLLAILAYSATAIAELQRHPEFPTYFTHANGISIAYQDFGDPSDEAILLIMGLGAQLIHWDDDFVKKLVDKGFRVIRFDNRDIGLSEKFYNESTPGLFTFLRFKMGWSLGAPYQLTDMATDSIALLDNLEIDQAHVIGVSMGGIIAQIMAARYPQRLASLTSIMSTTGAPHLPEGSFQIDPSDRNKMSRDEAIESTIAALKGIYGTAPGRSDEDLRIRAARGYDRSSYSDGFSRQFWATLDSGDRSEEIKTIKTPTLVVHGKLDPLLPLAHGEHTAELIPQAQLLVLDDMAHYFDDRHHARVIDALLQLRDKTKDE